MSNLLTDKEVGELWCKLNNKNVIYLDYEAGQDIIRKLVAERARWHANNPDVDFADDTWLALRDFGIDPVKWPK